MAVKSKLRKFLDKMAPQSLPAWQPGEPYPRLLLLDAASLTGKGGLYALWHLGVRPQWLRVGAAADLAAAAARLKETPDIIRYEPNGGLFFAWLQVPKESWSGMVKHLAVRLAPAEQGVVLACDAALDPKAAEVSCALPPGAEAR